jgi:recombination protein RecT
MSSINDNPKGFTPTNKSGVASQFKGLAERFQSTEFIAAIEKTVPSGIGMTSHRIIKSSLAIIQESPELMECTPKSIEMAVRRCAYFGLDPDPALGQTHFIARNIKGVPTCSLMMGYRGMTELAYRCGVVKKMQPIIVHENDVFEYEMGMDPKIIHKPNLSFSGRGKSLGAYVTVVLSNGEKYFDFMLAGEIENIRKESPGKNSAAWGKSPEEMYKKTVIRRVFKHLPITLNANHHAARLKHAVMADEYLDANKEIDLPLEVIDGEFVVNESETPIDENTEFLNKLNVKNG